MDEFTEESYDEIQKKGTPTQIDSHEFGPPENAIDGKFDSNWEDADWFVNSSFHMTYFDLA